MKTRNALLCLTVLLALAVRPGNAAAYDDVWTGSDMGAGGWWNGIEAGIDGTVLLNSDLSGSYISRDGGKSWDCIGENRGLLSTHASGMGFDPADANVLFIGTDNGIYRSGDKGETFTRVLEGGYCADIAIAKSDHNIGYAAVTSRHNKVDGKIYKTTDNGRSWTALKSNLPENGIMVQEIYIDPGNPNNLYAHSYNGRFVGRVEGDTVIEGVVSRLYRSTDGGLHWQELGPEVISGAVFDFAVDPADFNTVYASGNGITQLEGRDTLGIRKSVDGGQTWTVLTPPGQSGAIHISRQGGDVVLRVFGSWRYWTSRDGGKTWNTYEMATALDFSPGVYFSLASDTRKCDSLADPDTIYWCNAAWVWKWDANQNKVEPLWTDRKTVDNQPMYVGRGVHNTNALDIEISDANPEVIYACFDDMGLWRSLDHGESWQSCNNTGIGNSWPSPFGNSMAAGGRSKTVEADPVDECVVWAGLGSGLYRNDNYGLYDRWKECTGLPRPETEEGAVTDLAVAVGPGESRILYAILEGKIYKSTDGSDFGPLLMPESFTAEHLAVAPENPDILYAGGPTGLYKFEGNSSAPLGGEVLKNISDVVCDPSQPGRIYVACLGSGLYRSTDGGGQWEKLLTDRYMRGVTVNPKDPENLFTASSCAVTSGGYSPDSKGIQVSYDGGKTWAEANQGLAWRFAWKLALDPEDPQRALLATRGLGVQRRNFRAVPRVYDGEGRLCQKAGDIPENGEIEIRIPEEYVWEEETVLWIGEYRNGALTRVWKQEAAEVPDGAGMKIQAVIPGRDSACTYRFFFWAPGSLIPRTPSVAISD